MIVRERLVLVMGIGNIGNIGNMMKVMNAWNTFKQNHPKFPAFVVRFPGGGFVRGVFLR